MSEVIHWFVDSDGKTNVDQFRSDIPLDMESIPDEYHVVLATKYNSSVLADMYKECAHSQHKKLMVGCPSGGPFDDFESAKYRVRELCFENDHPVKGGLRAASEVDYINARVVSHQYAIHKKVDEKVSSAGDVIPLSQLQNAISSAFSESDMPSVLSTVVAHPLWKRMSWIRNVPPVAMLGIIGELVDPTWYVNPAKPTSAGLFKERCGVFNCDETTIGGGLHESSAIWRVLSAIFLSAIEKQVPTMDELVQPSYFFVRYGLHWMGREAADKDALHEALPVGVWRHNTKMINFLWLNWMEVMHDEVPEEFDDEKFFYGDKMAAEAAYRAAVS